MNKIGSKYNMLSASAGLLSAVLFLGMFVFKSILFQQILMLLSPVALAIPALAMGVNAVLIASLIGAIAILVIEPNLVMMYLILDVIPVIAMTYLFIRVYENKENPTNISIGKILSIMSLLCMILMTVFIVLFPYQQAAEIIGIQATSLKDLLFQMFSQTLVKPESLPKEDWDNVINVMASYFPSALFLTWLFRSIVCMIFAQWIVSLKDKMLRGTPDYSQIDLPKWVILPIPVLLALILVGGDSLKYVMDNAFIVMLTPFLCLGLSQVHLFARKLKGFGMPLLVVFYIIFFLGYGYAVLVVSLLGIFEFFINQKLIKDKNLKE